MSQCFHKIYLLIMYAQRIFNLILLKLMTSVIQHSLVADGQLLVESLYNEAGKEATLSPEVSRNGGESFSETSFCTEICESKYNVGTTKKLKTHLYLTRKLKY